MSRQQPLVATVVIGRNEGERLKRCLASLMGQDLCIVYVDSGSVDGSIAHARSLGVEVVQLDSSVPFTAARGRNAGVAALAAKGVHPDYIQFVDGDCAVESGWIAAAVAQLEAHPELGLVTGWRAEINPDHSIYNAMCDFEWHRPAGPITVCGGDLMVRACVFDEVGGFNDRVICSEDEDFCLRIGQAGHGLWRLPRTMTHHDADMMRFSQWWRRTTRTGHGFAEVGRMHPPHFRPELRRVWLYGAALPLLALAGGIMALAGWRGGLVLILAALAGYLLSWLRTMNWLRRSGQALPLAAHHAFFLTLSKLPNLQGALTYYWRRWRNREMRLIEYK